MTKRALSRHAVMRMAQRGFSEDDLDLVARCGTEVEDGYYMREKDCRAEELWLRRRAEWVRRLSGTRVVVAGGRVITVYRARRKRQRRLLRSR